MFQVFNLGRDLDFLLNILLLYKIWSSICYEFITSKGTRQTIGLYFQISVVFTYFLKWSSRPFCKKNRISRSQNGNFATFDRNSTKTCFYSKKRNFGFLNLGCHFKLPIWSVSFFWASWRTVKVTLFDLKFYISNCSGVKKKFGVFRQYFGCCDLNRVF